MAFTVDDFHDLLRLLDQHPEWRAELRRHVLGDELPELPVLMRQLTARVEALAEAQARTEAKLEVLTARVDALVQAQARTDARVDALTEQMAGLTARVDALTERLDALTARVDALTEQMQVLVAQMGALAERMGQAEVRLKDLGDDMAEVKGEVFEARYARRAGAYFSPLARRVRVLDFGRLADALDDAVEAGQLTAGERAEILATDLVLTGVHRDDRAEIYLLVEVSAGIGPSDVKRAADRAALLARLGRPVVPVVAGKRSDPEPDAMARAAGVWQVLDGHAIPPDQPDGA
jgi:hypothetical protein